MLWQLSRDAKGEPSLHVSNRAAYHVSLQDLRLEGAAGTHDLSDYLLLPPGASRTLPVIGGNDWQRLSFRALTDYGGARHYSAELDWRSPFKARLLPDTAHLEDLQP